MSYDTVVLLKYNITTNEKHINKSLLTEKDVSLLHVIEKISDNIMGYIIQSNQYLLGDIVTTDIRNISDWMLCDIFIMLFGKSSYPHEKLKLNMFSMYKLDIMYDNLKQNDIVIIQYGDNTFCLIGTSYGILLIQYINLYDENYFLVQLCSIETIQEIMKDLIECNSNRIIGYKPSKGYITEIYMYHRYEFSQIDFMNDKDKSIL